MDFSFKVSKKILQFKAGFPNVTIALQLTNDFQEAELQH